MPNYYRGAPSISTDLKYTELGNSSSSREGSFASMRREPDWVPLFQRLINEVVALSLGSGFGFGSLSVPVLAVGVEGEGELDPLVVP